MAYNTIYTCDVTHKGLNKYRHIKGSDLSIVEKKADAQLALWDGMWNKKQEVELNKRNSELAIRNKEENKLLAIFKTDEAKSAINELEEILLRTLSVDDVVNWSILLLTEKYSVKQPKRKKFKKRKPTKPSSEEPVAKPIRDDPKYYPYYGFFGKLFSNKRLKIEEEAENRYVHDCDEWEKQVTKTKSRDEETASEYPKKLSKWEAEKTSFEIKQNEIIRNWELEKEEFENNIKNKNKIVMTKEADYKNSEPGAISDYCEMVLTNSKYPEFFPQEWDIEYDSTNKLLIVDYSLPELEKLPTLKAVKYISSRNEFTETHLTSAELNKLYDSVLYQTSIRTIHELYEADVINAISSIVFNGFVNAINRATGHRVNSCIMSVQASKEEFLAINLENVDPKSSFKQLKGVGSSKLYGLAPIPPIINIDRNDRRFVSAYDVVYSVDETINLAAMDWQDFENLIREVFEKEFSSSGGEVKITQASRDGGVDAIAFDPDPIRGGKIVIQAKRYTNVVGVSAVRDLFGTTINEGATKGILVTTASYGPDAYEFVKGKPLTLLNGSNLLHLLEKHGHKAKIDIKEAKKFLAEVPLKD